MRILCLDVSTHSGWALMTGVTGDTKPELNSFGLIENDKSLTSWGVDYPINFLLATDSIVDRLVELVGLHNPDLIVIEETNMGRSRYSQKALEFLHHALLSRLDQKYLNTIHYISSSIWRQTLDLRLDSEQKKNNAKLNKAKKLSAETKISINAAKKKLGVRGKITKKHLAVNRINDIYDLHFKVKDNDIADAICLGLAYFLGAKKCDGILG